MNTLKTEVQQQHVRVVLAVLLAIGACMGAEAHPGGHGHDHEHDDEPSGASEVRVPVRQVAFAAAGPAIHEHFLPFRDSLGLRWDEQFYYVESDGMPDHPMMVGITAWQQQVPLPQNYTGVNAWRIPLHPVPAKVPMSAKDNFFRGAIALAVNGVPIFNPIKNDGRTDTLLAGELDQWGGHCGRGDDYHYHVAPTHLEAVVGKGQPIAYALDGYPIYGEREDVCRDLGPLDAFNGHEDATGGYHYHATKAYPYLNGGFHGEVVERGGQVDPQPRAQSPRPSLPPLRGATIVAFDRGEDGRSARVAYTLRGDKRTVGYEIEHDDAVTFTFDDGSDGKRSETFPARAERAQGERKQGGPGASSPRQESERQPRGNRQLEGAPQRGGPARREEAASPRKPWIEVHAAEMDTDADGVLTADELDAEASTAFAGYDPDGDGEVALEALATGRPVRSAMGGFIREHRTELDRDGSGVLSLDEVLASARRMFEKADPDGDQRIVITESTAAETPRPAPRSGAGAPPAAAARAKTVERRPQRTSEQPPPNIIFILVDDMGWRDVGFAGNTFIETPHIDRLAREGLHFTQAYASAPNCAPTRACLMSGQYTPRHGVYTVIDPRHDPGQAQHRILATPSEESLSGDTVTIAEVLKARGYATACFGMWNLGRGRSGPTTALGQGFDTYKKPQDLGFAQHTYLDGEGRYLTDVLFDEGMRFVDQHAHQPFFLYLPTHAIHAPFEPKPDLVEKYQGKARRLQVEADPALAATVEVIDQNVGRLMTFLSDRQLDDNTLIVFTSDNGGTPQDVAPLNGSKGALYEGGIRVPCAVWWQGIVEPGRTCDEPVLSMDFYPTLAAVAGAELPAEQPIDGVSMLPVLTASGPLHRDAVFWHFPCYIGRGEPTSAMRAGDWKLIEKFADQSLELYNLRDDPGETRNLAAEQRDTARRLTAQLEAWQVSLDAPQPSAANPAFDPAAVRQRGRQGGGKRQVDRAR